MTRHIALLAALALSVGGLAALAPLTPAYAQEAADPARDATREKLRDMLREEGPKLGVTFVQSTKEPYNFTANYTRDLKSSSSFEMVISVTKSNTLGFRYYPHYKGGYINLDKVQDKAGFARRLLQYNDQNFLYWGVDSTADTFAGYTITLESGFPTEAVDIALRSVTTQDKFVGQMRPAIDGSAEP